MTPWIYACISLLPALFIAPVYPHHIPTNEKTGQHKLNRFRSRAPAPGPAYVLCSDAAKFQGDSHDEWKPCITVFYHMFKSETRDFVSDLLWAPKEWHGTVLADKQCPQQFHQGQEAHSLWGEHMHRTIRADQRWTRRVPHRH